MLTGSSIVVHYTLHQTSPNITRHHQTSPKITKDQTAINHHQAETNVLKQRFSHVEPTRVWWCLARLQAELGTSPLQPQANEAKPNLSQGHDWNGRHRISRRFPAYWHVSDRSDHDINTWTGITVSTCTLQSIFLLLRSTWINRIVRMPVSLSNMISTHYHHYLILSTNLRAGQMAIAIHSISCGPGFSGVELRRADPLLRNKTDCERNLKCTCQFSQKNEQLHQTMQSMCNLWSFADWRFLSQGLTI